MYSFHDEGKCVCKRMLANRIPSRLPLRQSSPWNNKWFCPASLQPKTHQLIDEWGVFVRFAHYKPISAFERPKLAERCDNRCAISHKSSMVFVPTISLTKKNSCFHPFNSAFAVFIWFRHKSGPLLPSHCERFVCVEWNWIECVVRRREYEEKRWNIWR